MALDMYCPNCKSMKPMVKAGIIKLAHSEKQRWQCVNKFCRRTTINPLRSK